MATEFIPVNYVSTGTLQHSRTQGPLLPGDLKIDDHVATDFMAFVARLSSYTRYYDAANRHDGIWEAFFKNEYPFALSLIISVPLKDEMAKLQTMGSWLESGATLSTKDKNITAQLVFSAIIEIARRIDGWYLLFGSSNADQTLLNEITSAIENALSSSLTQLKKLGNVVFDRDYETETGETFDGFSPVWKQNEKKRTGNHPEDHKAEPAAQAEIAHQRRHYEKLAQILWTFTRTQSYIVATASKELDKYLLLNRPFKPHTALLMAYWQMYTLTQGLVNNYTKKHLDFYYRQILNLKKLTAQADHAFVYFQLAKGSAETLIPAAMQLDAGKDGNGEPIVFTADNEVVVNDVQVTQLMNLFLAKNREYPNNSNKYLISDIFSESVDPTVLPAIVNGWEPFGSDQGTNPSTPLRKTAGFAIASPIFLLNEGTREISIDLIPDEASLGQLKALVTDMYGNQADIQAALNKQLANAFVIYGSGAKNWVEFKNVSCTYTSAGNAISIQFTATPGADAILNYQNGLPGDDLHTTLPVIKIVLNNNNPLFAYGILRIINVASININVAVTGVTNLTLFNSGGKLDPTKPFQPFGQIPVVGSYLSVGNPELLQKTVNNITFNIEWFALPAKGFNDYYGNYVIQTYDNGDLVNKNIPVYNDDFTVQISKPGSGHFLSDDPKDPDDFDLFESEGIKPIGPLKKYSRLGCSSAHMQSDEEADTITKYNFDQNTRTGFYNIELSGPSYAFYNELYIHSMSSIMLDNAKKLVGQATPPPSFFKSLFETKKEREKDATASSTQNASFNPIPNAPYVPVIKSLNINYTASQTIDLSLSNSSPDIFSLFYLDVFSLYRVFPPVYDQGNYYKSLKSIPLLPVYNKQCYFYAAFEQVQAPQIAEVLVQVILKPAINNDPVIPVFTWEYLSKTGWVAFTAQQQPGDKTLNFSKTGIIKFTFISGMVADNPVMPLGKIWIRASIDEPSTIICKIQGIQAHAVAVTRILDPTTPLAVIQALPPNTIKGFINPMPQVKAVVQPAASFGGRNAEDDLSYYTRVSERLNHKQRAVTSYDYEHLILQQFPELYYVRCLNHTTLNSAAKSPGNVLIVVIPARHISIAGPDAGAPRVTYEKLQNIQTFITGLASPFAKIRVINPLYIFITVDCTVGLMKDDDPAYYLKSLNAAICGYLAPWTGGAGVYPITGKLTAYNIISFIENQAYIADIDIESFSISFSTETDSGEFKKMPDRQITKDNLNDNIIDNSKPWTIIASREKHNLKTN